MTKWETAYEGIKAFCAEQGFSVKDSDIDKVCTLVPAPESTDSILPAIKALREAAQRSCVLPMVLKYDGPFKQFMFEKGYGVYKVDKCLGLVNARDIIVFLRDNGFGTA